MAVIDISQVKISTLSMEIKTISLNKKQMTLSFFRQIPREKLIDFDSAKLNGVPWGRINYFWQDHSAGDIHVIWQNNNQIFRDIVSTEDRLHIGMKNISRLNERLVSCELDRNKHQAEVDGGNTWRKQLVTQEQRWIDDILKELRVEKAWVDQYQRCLPVINTLKELPQLFIAV